MTISMRSQIVASIVAFVGVSLIWIYKPPFVITAAFTAFCLFWSAGVIITIFRGTDELNSASLRYSLAFASGAGTPLCCAFVVLMIAETNLQLAITKLAEFSPLPSAAAGFGIGVTFTILVMCTVFMTAHSIWWISKR